MGRSLAWSNEKQIEVLRWVEAGDTPETSQRTWLATAFVRGRRHSGKGMAGEEGFEPSIP